jgi:hypothetical protein
MDPTKTIVGVSLASINMGTKRRLLRSGELSASTFIVIDGPFIFVRLL